MIKMRVPPEDYEWEESRLVKWVDSNWQGIFQSLAVSIFVVLLFQSAISPITHPNVQIASTHTEPSGELNVRVENFGDQKSTRLTLAVRRTNDSWIKREEIGSISPGEGVKRPFELDARTDEIVVFDHTLHRENRSRYRAMCSETRNLTENALYLESDSEFERSSPIQYTENGSILWSGTVVARWNPTRRAESAKVPTEFEIVVENERGEVVARTKINYPGFSVDNNDDGAPYPSSIILDKGVQACNIRK